MSLVFAIIPLSEKHQAYATEVRSKIKQVETHEFQVKIDLQFGQAFNTRLRRYSKKDIHVIQIDDKYTENKELMVHICGSGDDASYMSLDDFIELISNFPENYDGDEDEEENDKEGGSGTEDNDYCCMM